MYHLKIAFAFALAPVIYYGVKAIFSHYKAQLGKHGGMIVSCLQALLAFTPLIAGVFELKELYSISVLPATLVIPSWIVHDFYADYQAGKAARKKIRLFVEGLESIIKDDFDSLDNDGDELLNELDLVKASVGFKNDEPDKCAVLEQLLANIADVGHVVGVVEQKTYSDDVLIGTVKRNLYAIRKSDLRNYPAALRSQYQIW